MPRPLISLLLAFALPGLAGLDGRALAEQPELAPATVVYGLGDAAPAFEPRSRVQRASPPETAAAGVTVVRGIRTDDGLPLTAALGAGIDPALVNALAALCRVDPRRDVLAFGLPGAMAVPARF